MSRFFARLTAAFFPNRCVFCGTVTGGQELACPACGRVLSRITGETCPHCGRGVAYCTCKGRNYAFARCAAPFYYEGVVKRGILRFKFADRPGAAAAFGAYAAACVRQSYKDIAFDLITAVPMSRGEKQRRGYNQSAEFAKALAQEIRIPYVQTLRKPRPTKPQHELKAAERWGNVSDAFLAQGGVKGKSILLTDDIMTTGATLDACAKVLLQAGARSVCCVVIACVKRQ